MIAVNEKTALVVAHDVESIEKVLRKGLEQNGFKVQFVPDLNAALPMLTPEFAQQGGILVCSTYHAINDGLGASGFFSQAAENNIPVVFHLRHPKGAQVSEEHDICVRRVAPTGRICAYRDVLSAEALGEALKRPIDGPIKGSPKRDAWAIV